jgi:Leu/Phe-tRNA-protein transferase
MAHGFRSAGYDPWTKTSYRLDHRILWWCFKPRSVIWNASMQYTVGSLLFVVASVFAMFDKVHQTVTYDR